MAQKLIVATFNDTDVAQRAARDLRNFEHAGDGFRIESGVMIRKGTGGILSVLYQYTESYWGTFIGAVTGALIGLLGGPIGALAGATAGATAGLAWHTVE